MISNSERQNYTHGAPYQIFENLFISYLKVYSQTQSKYIQGSNVDDMLAKNGAKALLSFPKSKRENESFWIETSQICRFIIKRLKRLALKPTKINLKNIFLGSQGDTHIYCTHILSWVTFFVCDFKKLGDGELT